MSRIQASHPRGAARSRLLPLAAFLGLLAAGTASGQGYSIESYLGPAGSYFGWSVAGLGDLDGDGTPELAIGAPGAPSFAGQPVITGQVRVMAGATGALLAQLNGTAVTDRFGASVASLGDIDGDAVPEFIVGAPQSFTVMGSCYCAPGGMPLPTIFGPGYARVFSGATEIAIYTVTGIAPGDFFGESVAGTGDLDGDGLPDFVVGAPQRMNYWGGIGYVRTFSGLTGALLLTVLGSPPCMSFGTVVAGTGDVDGDGLGDLIVGNGGSCARVLSGASGAPLYTFAPPPPPGGFGASVAGPGDLDSDGIPDFFVGEPLWSGPGLDYAGRARAISGATGNVLFDLTGSAPYRYLGTAVASAGNLDGDSTPDVVARGILEIVAASGNGGATILPLAEGAYSLSRAGDQDGDGLDDLLIGYPTQYGGFSTYGGTARVVSTTGIPFGSSLFGAGCPGTSGLAPEIGATGGEPDVGDGNPAFGIRLRRARAGAPAILLVGASSQDWGGVPLPLDLGPSGLPGCSLLVSPDAFFATVTSAAGMAEVDLPVPQSPALVDGYVFLQWYVSDPGPFLLPGAMSPGLMLFLL